MMLNGAGSPRMLSSVPSPYSSVFWTDDSLNTTGCPTDALNLPGTAGCILELEVLQPTAARVSVACIKKLAHLCTKAAVSDGIGAAAPAQRAGCAELSRQRREGAPPGLQQQLPARFLPREIGENQCHVLIGVWLFLSAVHESPEQHRSAAAG